MDPEDAFVLEMEPFLIIEYIKQAMLVIIELRLNEFNQSRSRDVKKDSFA